MPISKWSLTKRFQFVLPSSLSTAPLLFIRRLGSSPSSDRFPTKQQLQYNSFTRQSILKLPKKPTVIWSEVFCQDQYSTVVSLIFSGIYMNVFCGFFKVCNSWTILTINYIVKYMYHGIFDEHFVDPYKTAKSINN